MQTRTSLIIRTCIAPLMLLGTLLHSPAYATNVQFQTSLGDFEVILYDNATPQTVANFLEYVGAGSYADTIIHRSVENFVIQGGGMTFAGEGPPEYIATNAPVQNEPVYSNVAGTIAMAKAACDPHSATSQWFFNLNDNSTNLDIGNGGYTVFGEVKDNGMEIINAIASLPVFDLGSAFRTLPLEGYTEEEHRQYYLLGDTENYNAVHEDNIVFIYDIVVTDAAVDTLGDTLPAENILIDSYTGTDPGCEDNTPDADNALDISGSSGGGSFNFFTLFLLGLLPALSRLVFRQKNS